MATVKAEFGPPSSQPRWSLRRWLTRPIRARIALLEFTIMSQLSDLATKINSDIDAFKASQATALAAKDATIADLNSQLDALKASDADTQAAIGVLQEADNKLTAP